MSQTDSNINKIILGCGIAWDVSGGKHFYVEGCDSMREVASLLGYRANIQSKATVSGL